MCVLTDIVLVKCNELIVDEKLIGIMYSWFITNSNTLWLDQRYILINFDPNVKNLSDPVSWVPIWGLPLPPNVNPNIKPTTETCSIYVSLGTVQSHKQCSVFVPHKKSAYLNVQVVTAQHFFDEMPSENGSVVESFIHDMNILQCDEFGSPKYPPCSRCCKQTCSSQDSCCYVYFSTCTLSAQKEREKFMWVDWTSGADSWYFPNIWAEREKTFWKPKKSKSFLFSFNGLDSSLSSSSFKNILYSCSNPPSGPFHSSFSSKKIQLNHSSTDKPIHHVDSGPAIP